MVLNYSNGYNVINNNFQNTLTWKINPASVQIKIDNKASKYGESLKQLTYSVVEGTVYGGDDIGISLNKTEGEGVGTYNISATCGNLNYQISGENGIYRITPRIISIKLLNQTFDINSYEEPLQNKFEILNDGDSVINDDDLDIVINVMIGEDIEIGEYNLTAVCNNPNYEIVYTTAVLKIISPPTVFALIMPYILGVLSVFIVGMLIYFSIMRYKRYGWKRRIDY